MFKSQEGFSLIEVLIALVVVSIMVSGLLDFWTINDRLIDRTGIRLQALRLAKMSIERFKAELLKSDKSKAFIERLKEIRIKEEEEERYFKNWYPEVSFEREISFEQKNFNNSNSYWVVVKVSWDNKSLELRRLFADH
jgi:prepilin-type N-terminal cleavage/methylation domain-containing protein